MTAERNEVYPEQHRARQAPHHHRSCQLLVNAAIQYTDTMVRRAAWWVAALSMVVGCQELPEIEFRTEKLRIGTDYEQPLCAGDLRYLDDHVSMLERVLGASSDDRVTLYLFETLPEGLCSENAMSCYKRREDHVLATWFYVEHELVHAVLSRIGLPDRFFNEGIAEALSGRRTQFGTSRPTQNLALASGEQDYTMAGHFMRWLGEEYGADRLRRLIARSNDARGRRHALNAFRDVYGISMFEAETRFYGEAPWSYPGWTWCDGEPLHQDADGGWRQVLRLDCAEEDTYSSGRRGVYAIRTFEVSHARAYNLDLPPEAAALVWRCQDGTMQSPSELIWVAKNIGTEPGGGTWYMPTWLDGGTSHELALKAGRYRLEVFVAGREHADVELAMVPKLGPTPILPDP